MSAQLARTRVRPDTKVGLALLKPYQVRQQLPSRYSPSRPTIQDKISGLTAAGICVSTREAIQQHRRRFGLSQFWRIIY